MARSRSPGYCGSRRGRSVSPRKPSTQDRERVEGRRARSRSRSRSRSRPRRSRSHSRSRTRSPARRTRPASSRSPARRSRSPVRRERGRDRRPQTDFDVSKLNVSESVLRNFKDAVISLIEKHRLPCNISNINDAMRIRDRSWHCRTTGAETFGQLASWFVKHGYIKLDVKEATVLLTSSKWESEARPLPLEVVRREEEAKRARRAASPARGRRGHSPVHGRPYSPVRREYSPVRRGYSPVRRNHSPVRRGYSPARPDFSPPRRGYSPVPRQYSPPPRRPYSPVHRPYSPPPHGPAPYVPAAVPPQYPERRYSPRRDDLGYARGGRGYSPPPRAAGLLLPAGRSRPLSHYLHMSDRWAPEDRFGIEERWRMA